MVLGWRCNCQAISPREHPHISSALILYRSSWVSW
jgi:hypothetical protein